MISASKSTLSVNNLKILRPKVTKNLTHLRKKFCESPPRAVARQWRERRLPRAAVLNPNCSATRIQKKNFHKPHQGIFLANLCKISYSKQKKAKSTTNLKISTTRLKSSTTRYRVATRRLRNAGLEGQYTGAQKLTNKINCLMIMLFNPMVI